MVLNNGIRLFSSLVLTRLLAPDLYGLMAVGNVIVSALVMLSDIGLTQSVIQSARGEEQEFLDTIWSIRLIRGFILAAILIAVAGLLALLRIYAPSAIHGTYGDPRLVTILLILAAFPVADGFESTNLALQRRGVNLRPVVLIDVLSQLCATLLMVIAASMHPALWILPSGWVLSSLLKSVSSYALRGSGNRFKWDAQAAREIWHFSKWILISSSLTFIYRDGDRFVLGALFNASEMGLYGVSILLLTAAKQVVSSLSGNIGLPALAQVSRNRPEELRKAYRRCRNPIDIFCLAASGFMFGGADLIIKVLYDTRYQGAAPIFRLLALILIAHRYVVFDDFLVATGNTRQLFKRGLLQVVVLLVSLPLGYRFGGMTGAVLGVLASNFSIVPLLMVLENKSGVFDWRAELKLLPIFFVTAGAAYALSSLILR